MEIAALKKKQQTVFDPMIAGTGTPWEDRGTHGTVGAFFKTCSASMSSPGKLLASIRRPETTNDARGFLIGISIIWGFSALMHIGIKLFMYSRTVVPPGTDVDVDPTNCAIYCAVAFFGVAAAVFFLFNTYVKIYGRLIAQEQGSPLMPETLLYNVSVYALGPSLLAVIPVIGPIIAIIWVFANLVVGGSSRLQLKMSAAIIDALLSLLAVLAIMLVIAFVVYEFLFRLDIDAVSITLPKKVLPR